MRRSFVVLVCISVALNAAVLTAALRARGDVCAFATSVSAAAHGLPQVPARVQAEQAYAQLQHQLNC